MLALPYTLSLLPLVISFISLFAQLEGSVAGVSNRTIDDGFGDSVTGQKPVFLPNLPGVWQGEECPCPVNPNKTKTFKQTFNAATYKPELGATSIGLNFKGTAIYVFFTIANTIKGNITTLTECNFTLDDQHAGYYRHDPTPDTKFLYQVPVFKSENLQNTDHILNISTSGLDYHTFTNFDYAIYTFVHNGSSPLSKINWPFFSFDDSPAALPAKNSQNSPNSQNPSPINQSSTGTSAGSASASNHTTTNTNAHSPNGTTTGSAPVTVSQPGAAAINQVSSVPTPSQPGDDPALANSTRASATHGPSAGTIAGGVLSGTGLIVLALLLFVLYRRQKFIEEAKLASVPPSGATAVMTVNPVLATTNYGRNHPDTISPAAPIIQDLYGNFPQNRYARAGVGILEGSSNGIHYAASVVSRWRRNVAAYNPRSSSSLTSRGWRSVSGSSRTGGATTISHASTGEGRGKKEGTSTDLPDSQGANGRRLRAPRRRQDSLSTDTERQMREVGEEMRELGVQMSRSRSGISPTELAQMREQMRLMQEKILYLESLQGSGGPGDRKKAGKV